MPKVDQMWTKNEVGSIICLKVDIRSSQVRKGIRRRFRVWSNLLALTTVYPT